MKEPMKNGSVRKIITLREDDDPIDILKSCGGYYACPKDKNRKRLGPLVGYAGKYSTENGEKQWVGDVYFNFAKAEEYPYVLKHFAEQMRKKLLAVMKNIDIFCGAPIGGYDFATVLGLVYDRRKIKAEKKVIALATGYEREKTISVFGRHDVKRGERVAIVEDVCNNFSTTKQLIDLIEVYGGQVTAIVCVLNRSLAIEDEYGEIPVISLIRMPISEYRQDDPAVAKDIAVGNIIWKPKDEWDRLRAAMN